MFDEDKAIIYIQDALAAKGIAKYPDDEILNVIDIIWDYYDEAGMLDIDDDDDESPEEADTREFNAIVSHVRKMLAKDSDSTIEISDVPAIVRAEIDYENTLV